MAAPCYPADLKDPKLTTDEAVAIWHYARDNYFDKGIDFPTTIKGVGDDLGLNPKWVAKAIADPKSIRSVSPEQVALGKNRREMIAHAKEYTYGQSAFKRAAKNMKNITREIDRAMGFKKSADREAKQMIRALNAPGYEKFAKRVYHLPRTLLTTFHYAVFPVTHGGDLIFRPTAWKTYFGTIFKAYRFASTAVHQAAMRDLQARPNYMVAKKAGLLNDPETEPVGILSSGMSGASRRGFDALKIGRQDLFDHYWDKKPPNQQTPLMAELLADWANKAYGATNRPVPFSKYQFAPQLTAAKWERATVDVGRTLKTGFDAALDTFRQWPQASPEARSMAVLRVRNAAEMAATYAGMLAVNQGLNQYYGSKDKINFSDFSKPYDLWAFKIHGFVIGPGSGVLEVYRLLGGLVALGFQQRKERKGEAALATGAKQIGKYATYKLEPTLGLGLEAAMGEDRLTGRPLPWNTDPTNKLPRMTWPEYIGSHFTPIPLTGGVREAYDAMREHGMSALDTTATLKAALVTAIEATGLKAHEIHEAKPKPTPARQHTPGSSRQRERLPSG